MQTLELLAPARNLACGIEAIRHGADAVYIGADRFGARAAAGNTVADIAELCGYAHQYGAWVYVTVNTIIYEDELADTQQLIVDLARAGVDALLVQDMATLELRRVALEQVGRAPVLHASTQMDTRTAEKVGWLRSLGFRRAVLARELSLDEIRAVHKAWPDMELEVFVHGALCVSYSGLCYASHHCFSRSANRGECAQMCRMKYDLVDADGKEIVHQRHLLSLKDLCQIDHLEELADAGACSFKIEGRLKGADYVKNVVSAYSRRLDKIVAAHPEKYRRASMGRVAYAFEPDLKKTFNRGFTTYFLSGRQPDIASFDTPKALGEMVGRVKEIRPDSFNVSSTATFANGDGLCFINDRRELVGFRVNRAVGNRLYPFKMPQGLKPHTVLYRNSDEAFGKLLSGQTADRRIPVEMTLDSAPDGFCLEMRVAGMAARQPLSATVVRSFDHQEARSPQSDNMRRQLAKLGNTAYEAAQITITPAASALFLPSSLLADMRREATEALAAAVAEANIAGHAEISAHEEGGGAQVRPWQPGYARWGYTYNISNPMARSFYAARGLSDAEEAFEVKRPNGATALMQCRHCIRYSLGFCVRRGGKKPDWREPLSLRLADGRCFRLEFDCAQCQMNVLAMP